MPQVHVTKLLIKPMNKNSIEATSSLAHKHGGHHGRIIQSLLSRELESTALIYKCCYQYSYVDEVILSLSGFSDLNQTGNTIRHAGYRSWSDGSRNQQLMLMHESICFVSTVYCRDSLLLNHRLFGCDDFIFFSCTFVHLKYSTDGGNNSSSSTTG